MSDYFIFDDIDTRNYEGISVYFDEVDTTPKRVGEFIEIPNRNGSLFLDSGRYEDVTHTYDIIALSMQNGRNLINALASKVGHHRLEDSFNTGEYYSAVFDTEVEPTVTMERDKITFKVIFTRKPQRFLTSGETEVTVASGGTLTNPTLFDSSPMIEIKGYGNLFINGEKISVQLLPYGWIQVSDGGLSRTASLAIPIQTEFANTNDTITVKSVSLHTEISTESMGQGDIVVGTITGSAPYGHSNSSHTALGKRVLFDHEIYDYNLKYGTATSTSIDDTYTLTIGGVSDSMRIKFILAYDGSNTITLTEQMTPPANAAEVTTARYVKSDAIMLDSTQTQLNPAYIDLEMGEAYIVKNGEFASVNSSVTIPAKLPTLKAGSNTITFGNTFTSVKITPRWWRV